MTRTTTATTTTGSNTRNKKSVPPSPYEELKIHGPPLYSQATLSQDFTNYNSNNNTNEHYVNENDDEDQRNNDNSFANPHNISFTNHPNTSSHRHSVPMNAGTTALLVVDVQPEYWSQCPAVRQDFPEFPSSMASLLRIARTKRTKIIWIRADYRYSHSPWLVQFARLHRGNDNIPEEVHCGGPRTAEWEPFATPQGGEFVIPKTSWCSTSHTSLTDLLQQSGIGTVLVCGLITSVCVQHSAFGIFEAGYRTVLVTDACADRGRARHDAALALYGDYMYELITTEELEDEQKLIPAEPVWLQNNTNHLKSSSSSSSSNALVSLGGTASSGGSSHCTVSVGNTKAYEYGEEERRRRRVASPKQNSNDGEGGDENENSTDNRRRDGHKKRSGDCAPAVGGGSNNGGVPSTKRHRGNINNGGDGGESLTSSTSTASSLTLLSSPEDMMNHHGQL